MIPDDLKPVAQYTQGEVRDLAERVFLRLLPAFPNTPGETMANIAVKKALSFVREWQEHCKRLEVKP